MDWRVKQGALVYLCIRCVCSIYHCCDCQVRANFRTAITIPERSWVRFRDVISEFAEKQQVVGQSGSGTVDRVVPGVGGSAGDAGGGDKELAAAATVSPVVVDTLPPTTTTVDDSSH